MVNERKQVGVVVVTYNRLNLLKEVIESLRSQTYKDLKIVVVNNGSTDGTLDWLNLQEDVITITQENSGGAGGFHTGMKYVAENGYKYCWIMDDDVICEKDALEELLNAYTIKNDIGFVCSAVRSIDGGPMNVPVIDSRESKNGYPDYYEYVEYQMLKIKLATFVSVLIPTSVIKEMGLPYKEYFIWGDDYEYTERLSQNHYCYMVCRSRVVHKRNMQGILSFKLEKDARRLKNYSYKFRNELYNVKLYSKRYYFYSKYFKLLVMAISQLLSGNISKSKIIFKSLRSIVSFHPQITYPQ